MLWFKRLQEDAKGIFKEHPASIVTVFIFAVCSALLEDILNLKSGSSAWRVIDFIQIFALVLTVGFVLCESNYNYKKQIGKLSGLFEIRKSFAYIIVMLISLVLSLIHACKEAVFTYDEDSAINESGFNFDIFYRFFRFSILFIKSEKVLFYFFFSEHIFSYTIYRQSAITQYGH